MTSTVMGRCFFVFGTYVASSILNYGASRSGDNPSKNHHHLRSTINNAHSTPPQRTEEARKDLVAHLPGLQFNSGFEQFAGYLHVSKKRHVFYWYVESQGDPENDPVVLWTNGGPGCSGLFGFGTEHGPYYISSKGQLHENSYSWNKFANMLYVEQPAGVGFSYTDSFVDTITGDSQAASDNYQLIVEFFKRFPERQRNGFYIASESYGGHYVPQLTLEILKTDIDNLINFQGWMVGNPYVDPLTNLATQIDAFYSHGLIAKPLYDEWKASCFSAPSINRMSTDCRLQYRKMTVTLGGGINPYALDYPVCTNKKAAHHYDDSVEDIARKRLATSATPMYNGNDIVVTSFDETTSTEKTFSSQVNTLLNHTGQNPPFLPNKDKYKPCSQVYLERYLNQRSVQKALHVVHNNHKKWTPCSGVQYDENDVDTPVIHLYKELVEQGIMGKHSLKMLVFSGDNDAVCSTAGTQNWIWNLGVNATTHAVWKPWKDHHQTAGFKTFFNLGRDSNASFAFVTVHGAGHEVAAYRPREALELFRRFLDGNL